MASAAKVKFFWERYWGIILVVLLAVVYSLRVLPELQDFHEAYVGARRFHALEPLYQVMPEKKDWYMGYKYTPFLAMLVVPIGMLPFALAKTVWVIVNAMSVGVIFWLLRSFSGVSPRRHEFRKIAIFSYLASYIYFDCLFVYGQMSLVLMLLQLLGVWMIMHKRPYLGGFSIGLGIMIKLTPLIFVPYLVLRRSWRALSGLALAVALGIFLPALSYGLRGNWQQLQSFHSYLSERHPLTDPSIWKINDNLQSVIFSIFGPIRVEYFGMTKNIFYFSNTTAIAIFAFCLISIALAYLIFLLKNTSRLSDPLAVLYEVALLLYFETILSPMAHKYTFVQLLPLVYLLFVWYDSRYKWGYWILIPLGILITIPQNFTPHSGPMLEFYWLHFWYALYIVGFGIFIYRSRRPGEQT